MQQIPRTFEVRYSRVVQALLWLREQNPLYADIEIRLPAPGAASADTAYSSENLDPADLAYSTALRADPQITARALQQAVHGHSGARAAQQRLFFDMQRIDARPVSIHFQQGLEALAFVQLYPDGQNHWGTSRQHQPTMLMYFRARILGHDTRFQDPLWMGFAVSTAQYLQLTSSVNVAMRQSTGPVTLRQLQRRVEPDSALAASESCWAFMRNIRGTAAYWHDTRSDLFAMLRACGPACWFMTFSADDMGWDDLALVLSRQGIEDPEEQQQYLDGLTHQDRINLLLNDQVGAGRHFLHRWNAFLAWMTGSEEQPVGNVTDHFWRIEFQKRGSPHIHMLVWVDGAPDMQDPSDRCRAPEFIDTYISTQIPEPGPTIAGQRLHHLASTVQQHRHTSTCHPDGDEHHCRFKYPRQPSPDTHLRRDTDHGLRRTDFYVTARGAADTRTTPYNPACLLAWQANMDIQLVGSMHGTCSYVCSYMTKGETDGIRDCISSAVARLPAEATLARRLTRIGTACLSQREYSTQEATFLLAGLDLRGSSRTFVRLQVGYVDHRACIITTDAIRRARDAARANQHAADDDEGDAADNTVGVSCNVYDYYSVRPPTMDSWSLFDFVTRIQCRSTRTLAEMLARHPPAQLQDGSTIYFHQRGRPAIPRIAPRMTPESHGDEYYFSLLQLHLPWRVESCILGSHATAQACFMANGAVMAAHANNEQFADDIQAACTRLRALDIDIGGGEAGANDPDHLGAGNDADGFGAFDPDANLDRRPDEYLDEAN